MSNFKAKGFESPSQMREYLSELDEADPVEEPPTATLSPQDEIDELRQQVARLKARLLDIRGQTEGLDELPSQADRYPWLRIVLTAATTFVLARLAQQFRLGGLGAAAAPLLSAKLDRKFW